ncbi:hypothetical protein KM043_018549 [Ampulex compressa]|nr:hypothetical protein KM043_018549 [Ampulex compressa]
MLFHSRPNSFDNFCCAIKSRDTLPDIDLLMIKITEEHDSKTFKSNESGSNALMSKQQRFKKFLAKNKNERTDKEDRGDSSNPNTRVKCDYCKKKKGTGPQSATKN